VIEQLIYGGSYTGGDPDTTILWVTDDPSLNLQTSNKMMAASDMLHDIRIIGGGRGINQETFDPGVVYLLNIQAAARTSTISNKRDRQQFTIWETLANTARERGSRFLVFVDEAHRGLGTRVDEEATIASRIVEYAPVFVGISATTDRLSRWLDAEESRTQKVCKVPIEAVQQSGLVKDLIMLHNPSEADARVASDTTLIREAVRVTREMEQAWADYTTSQNDKSVLPVLVIQVANNTTDEELFEVIEAARSEWPGLKYRQIVNTFGYHTHRDLGGSRIIAYMPPHEIQDATNVRIVIAKEAITTGWDCPRAEVLVSLRTVNDYTSIAQLIGRIVRQPLARRIDTDDSLNKVYAFLPYFDEAGVKRVAAQFGTPGDGVAPIEVSRATLSYRANPAAGAALAALATVPSYVIPNQHPAPATRRLMGLAVELAHDDLYPEAVAEAYRLLCIQLDAEAKRLGKALDETRERLSRVAIEVHQVTPAGRMMGTSTIVGDTQRDANNIDDLFRQAQRSLRDGVAQRYWNYLVEEDEDSALEHKITVAALGLDSDSIAAVESRASAVVSDWFERFGKKISELTDARRQQYDKIRELSPTPTQDVITIARVVEENAIAEGVFTEPEIRRTFRADSDNRWARHLYVDEVDGLYWTKLDSTEEGEVLSAELQNTALVGWYRNPPSGRRSLTIPYLHDGVWRGLHPDFVMFHETADGVRPTIIDPHGGQFADSSARLVGYLDYADRHADAYRFIYPMARVGDELRALPLHNAELRAKVRAALNSLGASDSVFPIFKEFGVLYG
jgi:hypothetical protein